ncbi:16S rRNA (cytidine(1402)-2'-O)-methyltransferase [Anaerotruncus massiliensis (ex Liu et al. 2021)]|uniref:Ribosomal RNA small subunit methyltransferase I n=2 Tax=Anaerotruncus TaxID=244127 RepID=A0A498CZE9_9FIRM|nr:MULTISPECIES: 16S rRNA (cytidine(1402)-2'-O)-methyltransferase [Anaerotruncus]MBC3939208.1 16S rRNA (cytidine(1402)-2'-O)-methyltransferase [Anaerotruncus massiliensis (ex Togo et al. 2019)]RLL09779.1 16S rRNA (cytidine(1402)-2'-O)-methyltransferase [Anaerotruncus massiliensis (ex Liu et al. 2021)]
MSGKLYVVGTPIGNLGDFSPRALETLQNCSFIAAEDTRVTLKLLNRFEIKKPLVSYYEHNIRERGQEILARILAGEDCAVVTDAGMPCISDPGEDLVRLCAENGVETVVVPGPSAAVSALAVSGLPTARFSFEGFLSVKRTSRMEHLEAVREDPRTLIFYEAPHKLVSTLADMLEAFGDRRIALARELTKVHEEVRRTTLAGAAAHYAENPPRGEFVLIVEGAPPKKTEPPDFREAVELTLELAAQGASLSEAAKDAARRTGYKKGELYKAALKE